MLHIEIWGAAPDWHLNRLVIKQNKLRRALLGVAMVDNIPATPTMDMYNFLNILTVRNLYKLYLFKFLLQMLYGVLPYFYESLLRPLLSTHEYNTRSGSHRHPMIHSEVERRSIVHQAILLHDSIPNEVYANCSLAVAVRKYKMMLLASQQ